MTKIPLKEFWNQHFGILSNVNIIHYISLVLNLFHCKLPLLIEFSVWFVYSIFGSLVLVFKDTNQCFFFGVKDMI